jgi:hypothetical protein
MTKDELEVQDMVISKLASLKITQPTGLDVLVMETEQFILNYCNISIIPKALFFVWANMVVDYYRWVQEVYRENESQETSPGTSTTILKVSSIHQGDTSVSFSADSGSAQNQASGAHNLTGASGLLDKTVMNYYDSLNRFRKVVW